MRALSVDALLQGQSMVPAVSCGWVYAAGTYQKVPIIEGSNHDEYRLFVGLNEMSPATAPVGPLTADAYLTSMKSICGEMAGNGLANFYPLTAYDIPGLAEATAGTDAV
jgi:para-nitrobenzyl esterase